MSAIIERALAHKFTLIAEIGVNYYEVAGKMRLTEMEAAKRMVREARDAGAHAVKFQCYKADRLAVKGSPAYWDTREEPCTSQYGLFKKYDHFGKEEYMELKAYSDSVGIEFLATAFDRESVDYLEPMVGAFKVSSSDLNNLPFIEYQAGKGKPMLVSVGAADEEEIGRALHAIRKVNRQPVCLMHCVLEYPTPYGHANLGKIAALKERYQDALIGYSDHTRPDPGCDIIKTAYNLGAVVVEKHFTLDKSLEGNDHYHAMDPSDARRILDSIAWMDEIRGSRDLCCLESEEKARLHARRSLVTACPVPAGTRLSREMLACKRPGTGIPPDRIGEVAGRRVNRDLKEDTILEEGMLCE